MDKRLMFGAVIAALSITSSVSAGTLTIHEIRMTPLVRPGVVQTSRPSPAFVASGAVLSASEGTPAPFSFYPVAGQINSDLYIAYYVDLDPGTGARDFNCGHLTYDGNTGEDPYIRSFREMDIGVPVYAALDGVVTQAHGGEADHNTNSSAAEVSNSVVIQHAGTQMTEYFHLRRDVLVSVGDSVTAGTQIGWVGSSGPSSGPHVHFESVFDGQAYEPMAGPCRPGPSYFKDQPAQQVSPFLAGAVLTSTAFDGLELPPYDSVVPTGTFALGAQNIYLRADLANLYSASDYSLELRSPDGATATGTGSLSQYQQEFLSAFVGIGVNLNTVGTWTLTLRIDGSPVAVLPFTVVSAPSQIVNRPPEPLAASIDPLSAGDVPVCRANSEVFADPDYETVTYQYQWTVDGVARRTANTAARTDALPRQFSTDHARIGCTVSASDGRLQSQPSAAFADVASNIVKRRAAGR